MSSLLVHLVGDLVYLACEGGRLPSILDFSVPFRPVQIRRHFLAWDQFLLPQVVEWLARNWDQQGTLNLADTLVVVPTRQSGRRLREALAAFAATASAAVFPPRVVLPDTLVTMAGNTPDTAPRLTSLLVWVRVLQETALDEFRTLFPVNPPSQDFSWALRLAQQFTRLQHELAESGLRLIDVSTTAGDEFPETDRWHQIGELEKRHCAKLAELGLRDRHASRIDGVQSFAVTPLAMAAELKGFRRVIVVGIPDPHPLAVSVLAAWAETLPIEVIVYAPAEHARAFDEWGRPNNATWSERLISLPHFEDHVHVCADPFAQAESAVAMLQRYLTPEDIVGLGIADPDVLPQLEGALQHAGAAAFNPEGRARKGDALYQLVSALAGLAASDSYANAEVLARCPDFLSYLSSTLGAGYSAASFLQSLDRLHARHLPSTLTQARGYAPENAGLKVMAELHEELRTGSFPKSTARVLARLFEHKKFDLTKPADALSVESATAWMGILAEIGDAAEVFPDVSGTAWWDLALRLYSDTVQYDEKPAGAIELQGWLELLWDDAPHLVIAGMNDGRVPEAVVGDPFLPEALRERLGLKTNAARFSRDAYLLQALAESRRAGGRLDLLLGKTSAAGDPLRPSRLLLRCADDELPERVRFLFSPAQGNRPNPAWQRTWKLTPRRIGAPPRVAVTALRAWLACPFRFYLGRVLRMETVESAKTELDVMDFGTLCHAALESMGRSLDLRNCIDAVVLREFLLGALREEATRRFGKDLTLPLIVQLESARQRLSRAADIQAATRLDGWVIDRVEEPFEIEIAGLRVSGKIDRIDRHEHTGELRVLDYKTSDSPVEPWHAHFRGVRRTETPRDFARVLVEGREQVWTDLQLPLYRRALQSGGVAAYSSDAAKGLDYTSQEVVCAYFNLPKASSETGIRTWVNYTREIDEAAWRCAEGVASAIRAGEFWPPNESIRADYDDFGRLFHHGVADSVQWSESPEPAGGKGPSSEDAL